MTPLSEANLSLLIYAVGITIVLAYRLWISYRDGARKRAMIKRQNEQMDRRDFLMDQAALRLKEFTLLMEELWQMKKN